MRLRRELIVLLVLIALIAIIVNDASVARAQLERHTPGFPDIALRELLGELDIDPKLLELLRGVLGPATAGRLSDAEIAAAVRSGLASGAPEEDLRSFLAALVGLHGASVVGEPVSPALLYELLGHVESEELARDLATLLERYEAGLATPEDVVSLLRRIEAHYLLGGAASPRDVLVATEVAQLVGRSIGYAEVGELAGRVLEVMASEGLLAFDRAAVEGISRLLGLLGPRNGELGRSLGPLVPSLGGEIVPKLPPVPSLGFSLPSLRIPDVNLSTVLYALAPAVVVVCAVVLARAVGARLRVLRSIWPRRPALTTGADLEGLRAAIRNYWVAVGYLESRYGLVRHPWETHREYLSKVSVGNRRAFEGLTEAYELAKYAQVESEAVDRTSDGYLRDLVGAGG